MFKWLFYYWFNPTDTPAIMSTLNLWAYINIRFFKMRLTNTLLYHILNLSYLYFKKLKFFFTDISFELFYFKLARYIIYILVISILFNFFL